MGLMVALILTVLIYTEYPDLAIPLVWISFVTGF